MWWDSWWSQTQCGNVRLAQTMWAGLWGWWPASVQCGWGTTSSPAWSWPKPRLVPVPGSPGTKQKDQEQGAQSEWDGPSRILFFTKSLPLPFERRNKRIGNHRGWLPQGLDGEDLGHVLSYHFSVWHILRISLKPTHRDCSQHLKLRHYFLRDVQTLSFVNSVHLSSPTTITMPSILTERAFGVLNCSCPFGATQNQPKTPRFPVLQRLPTSELIWAGTLTNSGLDANAVRFSTASIKGAVATRHLLRFSSEKSPSRAWWEKTQRLHPTEKHKSLLGHSNHLPVKEGRWVGIQNICWIHK